jgi:AAA domain/IclR helix-turn-helix domain
MIHAAPEFSEARRAIALADDKLRALEVQAERLKRCDHLDTVDIGDLLMDAALSNGLIRSVGADAVQHIIQTGMAGQTAFADPEQTEIPPPTNGHGKRTINARNIYDFLAAEFPAREMMLAPWLPLQGLAMCYAPRGGCKTHLAHGTAWAISTGTGFLRWSAPKPRRVLLLDGEMPRAALQERLRRVANASETQPPSWDNLMIAASDDQELGLPDLTTPEGQQYYAPLVGAADLIIVDNLSTICRGLKENEADSWVPIQNWALTQRRAGKSVLFIHHGGKSGQQRGTSRKEDVLDTVLSLRKPPDYSPEHGARFEIHFEKCRGFHGPDAEPFEVKLVGDQWEISEIKSGDDLDTLKALRASGLTIRDIADRTGLPRSTIHRRLEDAGE